MFLFGHIGITLGAALLVTGITSGRRRALSRDKEATAPPPGFNEPQLEIKRTGIVLITNWVESLGKFLDIRLLLIGSILSDIIDKPVGMFLFGDGRVFTHSLLVTTLLLIIGGYLYLNHRQTGVLAIGIGTFTHLILDQMWLSPQTLFWPLLGYGFPIGARTNYIPTWVSIIFHNPYVYITEAIGLLIIIGFVWILIRENKFRLFILRGNISGNSRS